MPNPSRPSGLELQALSVLYSLGPSTVAVVLENIPDGKNRAYTTILSVMQSLERKGLVKPTRKGRSYIYKPTKSQVSIVSPHVKDFLLNAFGGSICHAILHLLSTGALTPEEQTAVERNLNKQRAMAAKKKTTKRKAAAKRKPAKKAAKRSPAKKKAAKRKPAKKAAKRKPAKKKAAKRKPAKKKAAKRKPAKKKAAKRKPAKKKAAKRKPAKKKA
ncbi:MAG TPA: BlaI/MecI/CopY family transcriptional regulator, partial [Roseibacillus sp.]|nr:BlaI/MecI/CopY family transcriptional regulator [Roseibacillus sp.]